MGKKQQVIELLFNHCVSNNDYVFHNDLVKEISKEVGFGNPFDVTKIDKISVLPKSLIDNDYCLVHLGNGRHKFIKGLSKVFHTFEPIGNVVEWKYQKSILNQFNSSESNILSVANNQRILHDFLFGQDTEFNDEEIIKRPKTYFPHRTKTTLEYNLGLDAELKAEKIQIEIDLTIEFKGKVGVFEAKNGAPKNFSVYQLYHPFLYYYNANKEQKLNGSINEILGVYIVRSKIKGVDVLKLWSYTFDNPYDITSIKFVESKAYKLITE